MGKKCAHYFFDLFLLFYASYTLAKNSDFWYNGFMPCQHVYQEMRSEICDFCGGYTHKTDWTYQHELHKDWIASGKAVSQGWTSI